MVSVTENSSTYTIPNTNRNHGKVTMLNQIKNEREIPTFYQIRSIISILPNSQHIHTIWLIISTKYQTHYDWNTKYQAGIGLISVYQKVDVGLVSVYKKKKLVSDWHLYCAKIKHTPCAQILTSQVKSSDRQVRSKSDVHSGTGLKFPDRVVGTVLARMFSFQIFRMWYWTCCLYNVYFVFILTSSGQVNFRPAPF